jgi:hypothetical protein
MSLPVTPAATESVAGPKIEIGFNENGALFFGAAVLLLGAVLWAATGPLTEKTDFVLTYFGAYMIHKGEGPKLYDLREQERVKNSLFKHPNPLVYEHPPFEALLFAPLAALPFRGAYLIWGIVNTVIWLVLPYVLRPHAPVPKDVFGYFALWLLFAPLGVALFQGQTSLVLLLVYTATFLSLKHRHDLEAGWWLGFGLFKFQFVLPFALIILFRRRWKFLTGFLLSATLLGALSLIAVGWKGILSYVDLILKISRKPASVSYGSAVDMPTLHGFTYAVLGNTLSVGALTLLVAVISVFMILLTAWSWVRADRRNPHSAFDLMFAVALTVSLMTGLHMFTHDFSPLMLAMLLAAGHFPGQGRPALRVVLATVLVLLWMPPIYFALVAWHGLYLMFPILLVFAVSMLYLAQGPASGILTGGKRAPAQ